MGYVQPDIGRGDQRLLLCDKVVGLAEPFGSDSVVNGGHDSRQMSVDRKSGHEGDGNVFGQIAILDLPIAGVV